MGITTNQILGLKSFFLHYNVIFLKAIRLYNSGFFAASPLMLIAIVFGVVQLVFFLVGCCFLLCYPVCPWPFCSYVDSILSLSYPLTMSSICDFSLIFVFLALAHDVYPVMAFSIFISVVLRPLYVTDVSASVSVP